MTDELKLRFLVVDDEQSIRRLCLTVDKAWDSCAQRRKAPKPQRNFLKHLPPILCSPI